MDIIRSLFQVGAIQFGQFEVAGQAGTFAPISVNLRLLPSYPDVLRVLGAALAPLAAIQGIERLLPMPSAVPLAVSLSLASNLPLVYPAAGNSSVIEGAYDFNVPTVLLTDVLTDGVAESGMIKRVKSSGLDVAFVVAVLDMGFMVKDAELKFTAWQTIDDLLAEADVLTPSMRATVQAWLAGQVGERGRLWAR